MRTLATLIAATATLGVATAAQADVRPANALFTAPVAKAAQRGACAQSFATSACASYQNRVLRDAAMQASATPRRVSTNEVSNRQLDALLATIN